VRLFDGSLPPERVPITLQTRGSTLTTTYTDNEGRFGFYNLVPNPYYLVIEAEGYQPVRQMVTVNPTVMQTTVVHISLVPRATPKANSSPGPATGGNPNLVSPPEYLKNFPQEARKEFAAGVKADERGQVDEAIRHYQKAIQVAPDFYPARNNLGAKYLSKGEFAAAEKEFIEVIKLNQNDAQAYFNLGNVCYLTKRYEEAARALREGLKKNPQSALGYFLLGAVSTRTGDLAAAERHLQTAAELDPAMPGVRVELANLYLQSGRKEDAVRELKSFVQLFPKDPFFPKVKEFLTRLENKPSP
jgi:Flp pilus assembly protein TadD